MPVLPAKGEGWHEASAGADGEEAGDHRSKKGGAEKSARGTRQAGRGAAIRRTAKEVMGLLVQQKRAVLVGASYDSKRRRLCTESCMKRCTIIRNRCEAIAHPMITLCAIHRDIAVEGAKA